MKTTTTLLGRQLTSVICYTNNLDTAIPKLRLNFATGTKANSKRTFALTELFDPRACDLPIPRSVNKSNRQHTASRIREINSVSGNNARYFTYAGDTTSKNNNHEKMVSLVLDLVITDDRAVVFIYEYTGAYRPNKVCAVFTVHTVCTSGDKFSSRLFGKFEISNSKTIKRTEATVDTVRDVAVSNFFDDALSDLYGLSANKLESAYNRLIRAREIAQVSECTATYKPDEIDLYQNETTPDETTPDPIANNSVDCCNSLPDSNNADSLDSGTLEKWGNVNRSTRAQQEQEPEPEHRVSKWGALLAKMKHDTDWDCVAEEREAKKNDEHLFSDFGDPLGLLNRSDPWSIEHDNTNPFDRLT